MNFEYDNIKSNSNFIKHGIDFLEAQELWKDENLIKLPSKNLEEERFLIIAKLNRKCWTAIITYRELNVRIISVRRSRKNEEDLYESFRIG
ncbi:BrnT family toxin [Thiospirochaeta perfilievii]|uniref:BrnT family toxin n=1 Tax=Thiospirochaeta perfilievii TaxID=252967 RepID=A0A5C1Q7T0_9SPIO|nr:BrnT family toxin [Thiospirochaeta perfilievii]QEN04085.1 BrnT family toxin [Thiospirochaeta perfilievii]